MGALVKGVFYLLKIYLVKNKTHYILETIYNIFWELYYYIIIEYSKRYREISVAFSISFMYQCFTMHTIYNETFNCFFFFNFFFPTSFMHKCFTVHTVHSKTLNYFFFVFKFFSFIFLFIFAFFFVFFFSFNEFFFV